MPELYRKGEELVPVYFSLFCGDKEVCKYLQPLLLRQGGDV